MSESSQTKFGHPQPNRRVLVLAIIVLAALASALAAALLSSVTGGSVSATLAAAGGTFVAAVSVGLGVCQFLRG
ncbi:hypothetical protein [Actinoplanes lutulentus]|uniref:hypothetical protein n=1 Tax=Actinoplanes lutulentus TaxID=1287878 RepID=UPI0011B93F6C|nr:hypothetical protein [Actinoplanes lutulentus]